MCACVCERERERERAYARVWVWECQTDPDLYATHAISSDLWGGGGGGELKGKKREKKPSPPLTINTHSKTQIEDACYVPGLHVQQRIDPTKMMSGHTVS